MGILSGNPKNEPMHYGEVYSLWTFVNASKAGVAGYQTKLNHAGDGDLHKLLEETIHLCQKQLIEVEELLKENGVVLPPTPPERSKAELEAIPVGARIMDNEIGAMLSMDMAAGLVACSTIMGQAIREDIGAMFGEFHMQKAALGMKVLRLNKEKGWLIPPPLHPGRVEA